MTPTPKQREEFERNKKTVIDKIDRDIALAEAGLEYLLKERDKVEAATIEDDYFSFMADKERGE